MKNVVLFNSVSVRSQTNPLFSDWDRPIASFEVEDDPNVNSILKILQELSVGHDSKRIAWVPGQANAGGDAGVHSRWALAMDLDKLIGEPPWGSLSKWDYVAHTTHSHNEDKQCWRIVFPLDRTYVSHEFDGDATYSQLNLPSNAFEDEKPSWRGSKDWGRKCWCPPSYATWRINETGNRLSIVAPAVRVMHAFGVHVIDKPAHCANRVTWAKKAQASNFLDKIAGAVSGKNGSNETFAIACRLICEFNLDIDDALDVMIPWNERCSPAWTEDELRKKLRDAQEKVDDSMRGTMLRQEQRSIEEITNVKTCTPAKFEATIEILESWGVTMKSRFHAVRTRHEGDLTATANINAEKGKPISLKKQRDIFDEEQVEVKSPEITSQNIVCILKNDPELQGMCGETFKCDMYHSSPPPWASQFPNDGNFPRYHSTCDKSFFNDHLRRRLIASSELDERMIEKALASLFEIRKISAVITEVKKLHAKWLSAGSPDVASGFLDKHVGIDRETTDRFIDKQFFDQFVATIRRNLYDNYKYDVLFILVGDSYVGKTKFIPALCYDRDLSAQISTPLDRLQLKDFYQDHNKVLMPVYDELNSFSSTSIDMMNAFISSPSDKFRPSYGRSSDSVPRRHVGWGSANKDREVTRRITTNPALTRRLAICNVVGVTVPDEQEKKINVEGMHDDVLLLWGQAYDKAIRSDYLTYLTQEDNIAQTQFKQAHSKDAHYEDHEESLLAIIEPLARLDGAVPIATVLQSYRERFGREMSAHDRDVLQSRGWKRDQRRINKLPTKVWVAPLEKEQSSSL